MGLWMKRIPLSLLGIYTWWRHQMETFSALLAICAGNSPVTGEFPPQRPVTRSFGIFSDLHLNKWLSKQSWDWWFETLLCPLWRHCNEKLVSKNASKEHGWTLILAIIVSADIQLPTAARPSPSRLQSYIWIFLFSATDDSENIFTGQILFELVDKKSLDSGVLKITLVIAVGWLLTKIGLFNLLELV